MHFINIKVECNQILCPPWMLVSCIYSLHGVGLHFVRPAQDAESVNVVKIGENTPLSCYPFLFSFSGLITD